MGMSQIARFSVYEDYGANYDLIQQDVDETQQAIDGWADFDKAIEAISAHVNPTRSREANRKRAMTVKDLLIKVGVFRISFWMVLTQLPAHPANPSI